MTDTEKKKLFWACFIALVATSFVFGLRANIIGDWQKDFGLSEADKGTILGVGLWPFAISIIVFSLIIDYIGYKTAAYFAMGCHVASLLLTLFADGATALYWSVFLIAIANGTVEAFINPVVATIYNKEKAKWLNILHAGWPAGLALGALTAILLGEASWQLKYVMCFIPVVIYAVMIIPRKFPVNERVEANVSYREMLSQVGGVGFFIITWLLVLGTSQILASLNPELVVSGTVALIVAAIAGAAAWIYTKTPGHWMFLLVLLTMGPLATTELGTDSWMPDLLQADFTAAQAGWIFIYISTIMTILRFYAGPIVHKFSAIGLLVISAIIAIIGLLFLSKAAGIVIIVAATVYALGKTFLWSTTLGLVAEQFPKGGALTLNGVSAVGVLGMGILGAPIMGGLQDRGIDQDLRANHPAMYEKVVSAPRELPFLGATPGVDEDKVRELLTDAEKETLREVRYPNKKAAFLQVAVLPTFMLICYLILFFYFKSKGGYKPVELLDGEGGGSH
ncbi:MAG: MFS transporter [Verrucomicrobiales bacterium]|jgi:MFS family permease|nr:MFS transporter [Verrucomicrobiales bacterium]